MKGIHRYSVPVPLLFGAGAIAELGGAAAEWGMTRPLVVTDRGIRAGGLLDRAVVGLGRLGEKAQVFDGVASNPREEDVTAALELYRKSAADGIVAVGGGSAIDAAKAIRLLAVHGGTVTDYDLLAGGAKKITRPMPPLVAVPTTAGTGSEVSRASLIVTRRGNVLRKTVVASPRLVPSMCILDPELTVGLPPALTAGTGMDALSHCIEEHFSPRHHPVVDALALAAARKIGSALPLVHRESGNIEARGEMLMAAMMAGIGFEKGLGAVHSLSHAIGALHDLHHGMLNAVLMPVVLEFNRDHCRPGALEELASAVGLAAASGAEAADRLLDWLRQLSHDLGIPSHLREMKDIACDRDEIVARALDDHCHRTNPRPCGRDEFLELWERAW